MCLYLSNRVVDKIDGTRVVVTTTCGHCIECLKRRQNDWKLRICHECESWNHCFFFTLTYRDDMLPCVVVYPDVFDEILYFGRMPKCKDFVGDNDLLIKSTAYKRDVQDFIKRMREDMTRKLGSRWDMKYFVCAEYGPNPNGTKRPHYHGILLTNSTYNDLKPYFDSWSSDYGRIDFTEVGIGREDRSSVANYISKYCAKGCFESRKEDIDNMLIERAFSLMSKNIGSKWLELHRQDYLRFVPGTASVEGAWTEEDFHRIVGTDLYVKTMDEVDNLILNLKVYDGNNFGYKLPRYYYDRIINREIYNDRIVKTNIPDLRLTLNPYCDGNTDSRSYYISPIPFITFKTKTTKVKRFAPESFLSRALAYRMALLIAERDRANTQRLKNDYGYTDDQVIRMSTISKQNALKAREKELTSKLSGFYTTNMWNHREFDE